MKNDPIYYPEASHLLRRLSEAPQDMLCELLCLNRANLENLLLSFDKLLSAYIQVSDDLNDLQLM